MSATFDLRLILFFTVAVVYMLSLETDRNSVSFSVSAPKLAKYLVSVTARNFRPDVAFTRNSTQATLNRS